MDQRRSADAATLLAAIVVLIVGLTAVAFERGCPSPGRDSITGALSGSTLGTMQRTAIPSERGALGL